MEVHPAAEIFPLMADSEFQELVEDLRVNGQREVCASYKDKLLDGRNRVRACEILGIEPTICELDEDIDPIGYVLSANLHRRHLSESQRALIADRMRGGHKKAAKERMKQGGKAAGNGRKKGKENLPYPTQGQSRDAAGALLGVSGKMVDFASTVHAKGSPALIAAVESGELSVSRAATIAKTVPKAKQAQAITEKPKHTAPTPYEQLCKWWDLADASARARFRLYQDE